MIKNSFERESFDMNDSFDLISNNYYINSSNMFPTISKEESDSNGLVSLDMIVKNFKFTSISKVEGINEKPKSSTKQENNICTNNITHDTNKKILGRKRKDDQR